MSPKGLRVPADPPERASFDFMTGPRITGTQPGAIPAARPSGADDAGRVITAKELAHWRETGAWPADVSASDYVDLTAEEIRAMAETGAWPTRLD